MYSEMRLYLVKVVCTYCTSLIPLDLNLFQLRKPNDPGYDEFWADFNFGSNRLTIFCEECNATIQVLTK